MLTEYFFFVFTGAALMACFAMYTRQPLLVAYIVLGAILGPYGFALVEDIELLTQAAEIGIIFLLFLLGLDMQPKHLGAVLSKAVFITLISSLLFALLGFASGWVLGFSLTENLVIGAALMFSSTIISIKLLPTTVLHHRHAGELMIGLLLLQDFLAIFILLLLMSGESGTISWMTMGQAVVALPALGLLAYLLTRYALLPVIARFDRVQEFIFLIALGWCLGIAELAKVMGLSLEIGAFIAGISLATSPISQYIALSLRPLRDFFLIVFFFSIGAGFNLGLLREIAVPAIFLALAIIGLKPVVFSFLARRRSETSELSWDIGFRLGQISEFSLLIVFLAYESQMIGERASMLVQAAAILTFVISSYIVIFNFPNPIAISDRLRRD